MINQSDRKRIIDLINREVVPAIGCTEPAAVSLCVAKATEVLGTLPEKIELRLSGNIIKNAMGVGIPGTGMIGLPIAVALGASVGKSEYGLEVLRDVTPEAVEEGKRYIAEKRISVKLAEDAPSNLHIDVTVHADGHSARAVISRAHTNFIFISHDDEILLEEKPQKEESASTDDIKLNLAMVYDFAMNSPLDEISFILKAKELNLAAAQVAFDGKYGHSLGSTIRSAGTKYFGDTPMEHIVAYTSAACDARMGGAPVAVMSNSGSGNQGITATLPVVVYGEECGATEERMIRALTLSHLTVIYIKQSLGRLSALCGCVVAASGSSCGITYLMGGGYDEIAMAVKNMIANLTGMICDGAKPSCAMKLTSGVSTAVLSALMAMDGHCVTPVEGIIDEDVDRCIRNLTDIGRDGMNETDRLVLNIMTNKC